MMTNTLWSPPTPSPSSRRPIAEHAVARSVRSAALSCKDHATRRSRRRHGTGGRRHSRRPSGAKRPRSANPSIRLTPTGAGHDRTGGHRHQRTVLCCRNATKRGGIVVRRGQACAQQFATTMEVEAKWCQRGGGLDGRRTALPRSIVAARAHLAETSPPRLRAGSPRGAAPKRSARRNPSAGAPPDLHAPPTAHPSVCKATCPEGISIDRLMST